MGARLLRRKRKKLALIIPRTAPAEINNTTAPAKFKKDIHVLRARRDSSGRHIRER
jgi:hypothetical protein